jgi:hypothetical protein
VSVFKGFHFSQDLHIFSTIFKTLSLYCSHIIQFRLQCLLCSLGLIHLFCNFFIQSISDISYVLSLLLQLLLFGFDFHKASSIIVVIFFQFLKLSSLLEKSLRSSSALVLQDLFFLQISSFGPLHEFISVIFVPHFEVIQCIGKGSNFLVALTDFAIKLISIPLQFFLLLSCLNNIVSLGVLSHCFDLTRTRLTLLNKAFILNPEILNFIFPQLELDSNLMPFFLCRFLLGHKDIFMYLNLLLSLLH